MSRRPVRLNINEDLLPAVARDGCAMLGRGVMRRGMGSGLQADGVRARVADDGGHLPSASCNVETGAGSRSVATRARDEDDIKSVGAIQVFPQKLNQVKISHRILPKRNQTVAQAQIHRRSDHQYPERGQRRHDPLRRLFTF